MFSCTCYGNKESEKENLSMFVRADSIAHSSGGLEPVLTWAGVLLWPSCDVREMGSAGPGPGCGWGAGTVKSPVRAGI